MKRMNAQSLQFETAGSVWRPPNPPPKNFFVPPI